METQSATKTGSSKRVIPLIDARELSFPQFVAAHRAEAQEVVAAACNVLGIVSRVASKAIMPISDRRSHAWLKQTASPYIKEVEEVAGIVGTAGAYTLNASYEWACTTGAIATGDTVTMLRILDWSFPDLGKLIMVVRQKSPHGDFYNMTWPGYAGMIQGMAPGRFAAAINIAPMRNHGLTIAGDWVVNMRHSSKQRGILPAHLLRMVFEQAPDFETARRMLRETPVCAPVIYTLAGVEPGKGSVIERVEDDAGVFNLATNQNVTTANHFRGLMGKQGKWRSRGHDSSGRFIQSCSLSAANVAADNFDWLQPPIINWETRLAFIADASTGRLVVQGFEGDERVTELFNLSSASK